MIQHVIMRQRLVPGIALDAELEIVVPRFVRYKAANDFGGHVIVKLLPLHEPAKNAGNVPATAEDDLIQWIHQTAIIPRNVRRNRIAERRDNVRITAALRQEHFDARARCLCGLNENEFVFVRNDHCPAQSIHPNGHFHQKQIPVTSSQNTASKILSGTARCVMQKAARSSSWPIDSGSHNLIFERVHLLYLNS